MVAGRSRKRLQSARAAYPPTSGKLVDQPRSTFGALVTAGATPSAHGDAAGRGAGGADTEAGAGAGLPVGRRASSDARETARVYQTVRGTLLERGSTPV